LNHFIRREPRTSHVAGFPVHTIQTIVGAKICEQNFQQRNAAAIRRVTVADAGADGRADAFAAARIASLAAAAGARGVIFRGVGEDGKFLREVHGRKI
jgi:hypothetical protein